MKLHFYTSKKNTFLQEIKLFKIPFFMSILGKLGTEVTAYTSGDQPWS